MLKQLIQRLLDSRTTPEEAAHSAMPNSGIHMTVGDETTTTFIAPSDGYAFQNVGGGSGGVTTYSRYKRHTPRDSIAVQLFQWKR